MVVELLDVLLGGLGDEVRHRAHGVIVGAVAGVGRRGRARHAALGQLHLHPLRERAAELVAEVLPREIVRVVYEEVEIAQQRHAHAHLEVVTVDVLGVLPGPALGAVHLVLPDGHLRLPEEDREVVAAAVQRVLLPELNLVVREEEEDDEGPALELRRGDVVHHGEEPQHLPVVLHELLHVRVDVAAAKHHLAVDLLVGAGLRRPRGPRRLPGLHEWVNLVWQTTALLHSRVAVVVARELVAVRDADGLPVDLQRGPDLQVLRLDVAAAGRGEAVAPDQLALGDAAVVLLRLQDVAGVVLQVVEEDHLPDPVVLQVRLHDCLLEVAVEAEHVPVVGVPGRELDEFGLLARLEVRPGGAVGQSARPPVLRRPHGLDVLGLLVGEALLLLHALVVEDVPRLRLVVVLLQLVGEGVPRQEGQGLQVHRGHGPARPEGPRT
mmetsp:Transcript_46396/g.138700  ORF Transcript_46396/g.138700 Transcript_46396/m.138700 type:complete len:437 (-) Transcript_46396:31-1341(-)